MSRKTLRANSGWMSIAILLLLSCLPAAARDKITVTYAKGLDFAKFKTYAWAPHGAVAHPLLAADVVGAIEQQMTGLGLQKVQTNPDLIIQVYGSIDDDETLTSNDPLYMATGGIPPFDPSLSGPADIGMWGNTTVTVHKGQLVVDLIDVSAKKLAWRGMSMEAVSTHDPNKLMQEVNDAIAKIFQKYPVKHS